MYRRWIYVSCFLYLVYLVHDSPILVSLAGDLWSLYNGRYDYLCGAETDWCRHRMLRLLF
jgi:hypothetical protein